ncbi:MAG TPA: hypothetical protein VJT49_10310 [Amycolatopsis sp.]|uniref:hypothetical protein n=1 Tax=Amycolatopsis sp. TaxID=37632 RepID=UPI002B491E80|nr:hypothetical protein [Amycolatopsis sp.]HKS45491.1 hypothetical protein [Amycolatopsis sp.]
MQLSTGLITYDVYVACRTTVVAAPILVSPVVYIGLGAIERPADAITDPCPRTPSPGLKSGVPA